MSGEASLSREPLARQQRQLPGEVRSLRDDMGVMMAILVRLDGSFAGVVNELCALRTKTARQDRRLRALEGGLEP